MPFNMDQINNGMSSTLDTLGADIATKTGNASEMSEVEMLQLQQSISKWSIMVNLQSNIQRTWADALKAIVQNIRG